MSGERSIFALLTREISTNFKFELRSSSDTLCSDRKMHITLNVGGRRFETTDSTLNGSKFFAAMLERWNTTAEGKQSAAREIFIDRDPDNFREVLALLRDPYHDFPTRIMYELEFYGIELKPEPGPAPRLYKGIDLKKFAEEFRPVHSGGYTNSVAACAIAGDENKYAYALKPTQLPPINTMRHAYANDCVQAVDRNGAKVFQLPRSMDVLQNIWLVFTTETPMMTSQMITRIELIADSRILNTIGKEMFEMYDLLYPGHKKYRDVLNSKGEVCIHIPLPQINDTYEGRVPNKWKTKNSYFPLCCLGSNAEIRMYLNKGLVTAGLRLRCVGCILNRESQMMLAKLNPVIPTTVFEYYSETKKLTSQTLECEYKLHGSSDRFYIYLTVEQKPIRFYVLSIIVDGYHIYQATERAIMEVMLHNDILIGPRDSGPPNYVYMIPFSGTIDTRHKYDMRIELFQQDVKKYRNKDIRITVVSNKINQLTFCDGRCMMRIQ